jgi:lipopolysaccharide transport system ATP-binding protein
MNAEVVVERLGVRFELDRQRRPMTPAMRRLRFHTATTWALRGLSFTIESGTAIALTGPNGVGKTTLLRAIAGVLPADEGHITVRGRVGSLLSVNAGLMPRLTGRENALLVGSLFGVRKVAVRESLITIRECSGLDAAFERPVSTYSQGMRARLGFAVIEQTHPDILLLDEIHEALDGAFRAHLEHFVRGLCRRGGIVIAAGHDQEELMRLCDRTMALERSGIEATAAFGSEHRPLSDAPRQPVSGRSSTSRRLPHDDVRRYGEPEIAEDASPRSAPQG